MKFSNPFFETANNGGGKLPDRKEMDATYQWRLSDIFLDDDSWNAAFKTVESGLPKLQEFSGKLGESGETLLKALQTRDELEALLYQLYLYAGLKSDQDTRVSVYQGFRDRATSLSVKYGQAASFFRPEILAIPEANLRKYVSETAGLGDYRHYLEDILRAKAHTLPPEQEKLLAMTGEIAQSPYNVFSMFNNADIKFPSITDENGQEIAVTKGRMSVLMESSDRRVRKDAYEAMYGEYRKWTNTLAATLSGAVKRNMFFAQARQYPGALAAALHDDNIPAEVYENVVQTIGDNLQPLHRYSALRKKMLKLDALKPWDMNVPLLSEMKMEIPYNEAVDTIRNGLAPLGDGYLADLESAFRDGWIDVFENQGKRSGAYSWSTFGVHPYILLNYNKTLDNMFTIAHELGHAMHSFYTNRHQPYHYSNYTIFVAEVASTLNEALLMDYLLKTTDDPQKKLYLLNQHVDTIRGTVFIQSLFAAFEKAIHEKAESGEALTAELFTEMMRDLYARYYGDVFEMDELYPFNWCRIPHFYYNFYVYQYSTGLSAATALSRKILDGDTAARDAYLRFLTRGCSDYSINLLKDAGVDMTSPEPIAATAKLMDELLDQMEAIVAG